VLEKKECFAEVTTAPSTVKQGATRQTVLDHTIFWIEKHASKPSSEPKQAPSLVSFSGSAWKTSYHLLKHALINPYNPNPGFTAF
jgi:hypothetical protein